MGGSKVRWVDWWIDGCIVGMGSWMSWLTGGWIVNRFVGESVGGKCRWMGGSVYYWVESWVY